MSEKIIAFLILSAFSPVVVMALFDIQTDRGFWKDYLSIVLGICAISALALAVSAIVWSVGVVLR